MNCSVSYVVIILVTETAVELAVFMHGYHFNKAKWPEHYTVIIVSISLQFQASPPDQPHHLPCDSACKYLKHMKIETMQAHLMSV